MKDSLRKAFLCYVKEDCVQPIFFSTSIVSLNHAVLLCLHPAKIGLRFGRFATPDPYKHMRCSCCKERGVGMPVMCNVAKVQR